MKFRSVSVGGGVARTFAAAPGRWGFTAPPATCQGGDSYGKSLWENHRDTNMEQIWHKMGKLWHMNHTNHMNHMIISKNGKSALVWVITCYRYGVIAHEMWDAPCFPHGAPTQSHKTKQHEAVFRPPKMWPTDLRWMKPDTGLWIRCHLDRTKPQNRVSTDPFGAVLW